MSHLCKASLTSSCCKGTAWRSWTLKSNCLLCTASASLVFPFRRQIQSGIVLMPKPQLKTAWHRPRAAGRKMLSSPLENAQSWRFCCSVADSLRTLNSSVSQTGTSCLGEAGVLLEAPNNKPEAIKHSWPRLALVKAWQDYRSCAKYHVTYLFFADPKEEWRYPQA